MALNAARTLTAVTSPVAKQNAQILNHIVSGLKAQETMNVIQIEKEAATTKALFH